MYQPDHSGDRTGEGLHILLLCCAEYQHLVDYCIKSVRKNFVDTILSITIVANRKMPVPNGCRLILDQEFWKELDPDFKYKGIYNQNWIRQQIFKMYGDVYLDGNILILDPEVMFLRPTRWLYNDKVDLYVNKENVPWAKQSHAFVREILGIDTTQFKESFMSNATIFSSTLLKKMRRDIEERNGMTFFDLIDEKIIRGTGKFTLSEFDIYGYYLLTWHRDKIQNIIVRENKVFHESNLFSNPDIFEKLEKFSQLSTDNYVLISTNETSNTGEKTKWLTFYQQIKDPSWPDCDSEEEFHSLPDNIQKECIEIFGYRPKNKKL